MKKIITKKELISEWETILYNEFREIDDFIVVYKNYNEYCEERIIIHSWGIRKTANMSGQEDILIEELEIITKTIEYLKGSNNVRKICNNT